MATTPQEPYGGSSNYMGPDHQYPPAGYETPLENPQYASYQPTVPLNTDPNASMYTGGYGQMYPVQGYNNAMATTSHPNAVMILVLGIVGWFVPIVSFVAWYMGNKARKEEQAGMYAPSGMVTAGRVLGMIGSILTIIGFLLMVLLVIVGSATSGN